MANELKIGLVGLGNVGRGVVEILQKHVQVFEARVGRKIQLKTVAVRDLKRQRTIKGVKLTSDWKEIVQDPEIGVVVEVIGGEYPAFDIISESLKAKKYVVSANKEVISKHKDTFFKLARDNGVDIYFEAAVGGGIPLIRTFKVGYAANQIQSVYGILNGTCNYILTKIKEEKKDFAAVLKEAQKLGFAEADPSMDVSGLDAAYKLTILAAVAFKVNVKLSDVPYEGITSISLRDIDYATEMGHSIKLLAIARRMKDGSMNFRVHPTMLPLTHPLSAVRNEFNAIFTLGDAVGESMLYGKGAGELPTGSAVVSDILDIAFDHNPGVSKRNLEYEFEPVKLKSLEDLESKFYVRLRVSDMLGVLEKITGIFGDNSVNIRQLIQRDTMDKVAEIVIVTDLVQEKAMNKAILALKSSSEVTSVETVIRVGFDAEKGGLR